MKITQLPAAELLTMLRASEEASHPNKHALQALRGELTRRLDEFAKTESIRVMARRLPDTERERATELIAKFTDLVYAWLTGDAQKRLKAASDLERRGVKVLLEVKQ